MKKITNSYCTGWYPVSGKIIYQFIYYCIKLIVGNFSGIKYEKSSRKMWTLFSKIVKSLTKTTRRWAKPAAWCELSSSLDGRNSPPAEDRKWENCGIWGEHCACKNMYFISILKAHNGENIFFCENLEVNILTALKNEGNVWFWYLIRSQCG